MAKIKNGLLILLLFLGACSKYYEVDELYDEGDYYGAYQVLSEITKTNQSAFQTRFFRVTTRIAMDGDSDFLTILSNKRSQFLQSEVSEELSNYLLFADVYIDFASAESSNDYSSVVSDLSNLSLVPVEFLAYAQKFRGIALYECGNFGEAAEDLEESFSKLGFGDTLFYLGLSYAGLENYELALAFFQQVAESPGDDFLSALAYYEMGEIYFYTADTNNSESNYGLALSCYIEAVNHYSESAEFNFKIARSLQKLDYSTIDQRFLKACLRINEEYANAWYYMNIN